ncbi:MAG: histidinol phosphatase [Bacteroidetes bacterium]|nr:histidinol phosphatase [Bacteroidota bacterium]
MFSFLTKKLPIAEVLSTGFVDIHNHILPGIDDGAKETHDSLKMLALYNDLHTTHLIATPHIMEGVWENTTDSIQTAFDALQTAMKNHGLQSPRIRFAAEYMMDEGFLYQVSNKQLLCLQGNNVLVEMSYFHPPINLKDIIFEMQLQGYAPVLAHPERYMFYHKNMADLLDLKKAGCSFQLNLLSLTPHYGEETQKVAIDLLEKGYYDFVGTDAHKTAHLSKIKMIDKAGITQKIGALAQNNKLLV